MNNLLRDKYINIVEEYLKTFLTNYELEPYNSGEWVANDIGGIYYTSDDKYVNFDDIRCCVDNKITYDEFDEWYDYTERAMQCNISVPKLKAWHLGCPRLTEEELRGVEEEYSKIQKLKEELNKHIDDINKQLKEKETETY